MYDEAYYNRSNAEERAYKVWERERKNYILSLTNTKRKQEEWSKLFPRGEQDDSYLLNKDGIF